MIPGFKAQENSIAIVLERKHFCPGDVIRGAVLINVAEASLPRPDNVEIAITGTERTAWVRDKATRHGGTNVFFKLRKILHSWPAEATVTSDQPPPGSERQAAGGAAAGPSGSSSSAAAVAGGGAAAANGHGSGGGAAATATAASGCGDVHPVLQPQQLQLHFRFVLPLSGTPPTTEVDIEEATTWTGSPFYRLKAAVWYEVRARCGPRLEAAVQLQVLPLQAPPPGPPLVLQGRADVWEDSCAGWCCGGLCAGARGSQVERGGVEACVRVVGGVLCAGASADLQLEIKNHSTRLGFPAGSGVLCLRRKLLLREAPSERSRGAWDEWEAVRVPIPVALPPGASYIGDTALQLHLALPAHADQSTSLTCCPVTSAGATSGAGTSIASTFSRIASTRPGALSTSPSPPHRSAASALAATTTATTATAASGQDGTASQAATIPVPRAGSVGALAGPSPLSPFMVQNGLVHPGAAAAAAAGAPPAPPAALGARYTASGPQLKRSPSAAGRAAAAAAAASASASAAGAAAAKSRPLVHVSYTLRLRFQSKGVFRSCLAEMDAECPVFAKGMEESLTPTHGDSGAAAAGGAAAAAAAAGGHKPVARGGGSGGGAGSSNGWARADSMYGMELPPLPDWWNPTALERVVDLDSALNAERPSLGPNLRLGSSGATPSARGPAHAHVLSVLGPGNSGYGRGGRRASGSSSQPAVNGGSSAPASPGGAAAGSAAAGGSPGVNALEGAEGGAGGAGGSAPAGGAVAAGSRAEATSASVVIEIEQCDSAGAS
ncbi:hypothetical protein HYH02_010839 [Chlamydomonas schloesseri]|uniref:Uncharacterized protein n=1 Tax=Chlamydomonas schloesseri TaxID=2026947 RepID=A0A835T3X1_9CHLO|nr:hypothetical protein HYH02_010839 [Chlamydomonas schloesseri]|eukprot:KAG2438384.1 hypothetical protein HYH02_010839 [Chlamydomonas schloesseri]